MTRSEAAQILKKFRECTVLVAGDVMLDRYVWGTVTRLSPEAPVPIVAKERATAMPGGAANVAVNLVALGARVMLTGATGNDAEAAELRSALTARGVSAADLVAVADRRTTTKTRIIAHSQQLLRIDEEHTAPISSDDAERMLSRIERALPGADCAVISDYGKGVLTRELLARIIDRAKSRGVPVIVDPKGTDYSRYAGASVLTPNRHEAYAAAGAAPDGHTAVSEIGSRLIESLEIGALLITEGEHGMTLFQRGHSPMHIPAAARAVYDVTGAGDAVVAALALSLAARASLPGATYLANLAGGLAVEQVGTAAVSAQQIEALFEDHSRALPSSPEVRAGKAVQ